MRYDPLNKNKKRMLAGLLLASLLGTGTVWASPLEQGVKPAETVLLDETDGPLSHIQKKKQRKRQRSRKNGNRRKRSTGVSWTGSGVSGNSRKPRNRPGNRKKSGSRTLRPKILPGRTGRNGRLGNRQKRKNSGPCPLYPVTWARRIPTAL